MRSHDYVQYGWKIKANIQRPVAIGRITNMNFYICRCCHHIFVALKKWCGKCGVKPWPTKTMKRIELKG